MAPTASFLPGFRSRLCFSLVLISSLVFVVAANGQTVTYRLHQEASSGSLLQLKTANPDASITAVQSINLKNRCHWRVHRKSFRYSDGCTQFFRCDCRWFICQLHVVDEKDRHRGDDVSAGETESDFR